LEFDILDFDISELDVLEFRENSQSPSDDHLSRRKVVFQHRLSQVIAETSARQRSKQNYNVNRQFSTSLQLKGMFNKQSYFQK
jgi:hypothetical protein